MTPGECCWPWSEGRTTRLQQTHPQQSYCPNRADLGTKFRNTEKCISAENIFRRISIGPLLTLLLVSSLIQQCLQPSGLWIVCRKRRQLIGRPSKTRFLARSLNLAKIYTPYSKSQSFTEPLEVGGYIRDRQDIIEFSSFHIFAGQLLRVFSSRNQQ